MAHLPGTEHDVRARVPAADEAYRFMRDNVLRSGLVDSELKELCFRYLADDPDVMDFSRFGEREQLALRWAHAIAWDSSQADDELWSGLKSHFSEPELVELGCSIGFELGQQHWRRTVGLPARGHEAPARGHEAPARGADLQDVRAPLVRPSETTGRHDRIDRRGH